MGWLIIYNLFFSPKARVRRLFKEIYKIPIKLARLKRSRLDLTSDISQKCEIELNSRYKMINALLEYNFDSEIDKEYIKEMKEKLSFWEANTKESCNL